MCGDLSLAALTLPLSVVWLLIVMGMIGGAGLTLIAWAIIEESSK